MKTYAIVDKGIVLNTIIWDGDTATWKPQDGLLAVLIPVNILAGIGYTYDGTKFSAPSGN